MSWYLSVSFNTTETVKVKKTVRVWATDIPLFLSYDFEPIWCFNCIWTN